MSKERRQLATLLVMKPGGEFLETVAAESGKVRVLIVQDLELGEPLEEVAAESGKVRVLIVRDSRDGVYHWHALEFLRPSGEWDEIVRVGDSKLQEAIDLFTKARDFVKANPPQGTRE